MSLISHTKLMLIQVYLLELVNEEPANQRLKTVSLCKWKYFIFYLKSSEGNLSLSLFCKHKHMRINSRLRY